MPRPTTPRSAGDPVDALFAAHPGDFTAARNSLVKRCKDEGDTSRAGEIAALRRPSNAAWALNQLAIRMPERIQMLLGLGEQLRSAQSKALAGDREALQVGLAERRHMIDELVEEAAAWLADEGVTQDAPRDALRATLEEATVDPDIGRAVASGRLMKPPERGDAFAALASVTVSDATVIDLTARRSAARDRKRSERAAALDRAYSELDEARAARDGLEARIDALTEELDALSRELERAARRVENAEGTLAKLERASDP